MTLKDMKLVEREAAAIVAGFASTEIQCRFNKSEPYRPIDADSVKAIASGEYNWLRLPETTEMIIVEKQ